MQLTNKVVNENDKATYIVETDDEQSTVYILNDKGEKEGPPIYENFYNFQFSEEDIMENHNLIIRALMDMI